MTVVLSNFDRQFNDLYETEEWATEALLRRLSVKGESPWEVWEPSAGNHKIAKVLKQHGANVRTSDIVEYMHGHDAIIDFLSLPDTTIWHGSIITNPPYGKGNRDAVKYARKALTVSDGWVALLLTAKFDFGKTRVDLFRDNPRFCAKVVLMDRIQWFEGDHKGTEDHAWYIWSPRDIVPNTPQIYYEYNQ